jgi:hypothetical protein
MMTLDLCLEGRRKRMGRDEAQHTRKRLLGVPEVVLLLQGEPELRWGAEETGEAGGHLGGDSSRAGQNAVERLAGDAKLPRGLTD